MVDVQTIHKQRTSYYGYSLSIHLSMYLSWLARQPTLLLASNTQLHKELVSKNVLTDEEFWEQRISASAGNSVTPDAQTGIPSDILAKLHEVSE